MRNLNNYSPRKNLLEGRVILITGATQGLGKACALSLSSFGATVVIHGRDINKLEKVYDQILEQNGREPLAITLDFDQAEESDFLKMASEIEKQLGGLDGIIHSAVYLNKLSPLRYQSLRSWQTTMNVNLLAPAAINRACLDILLESEDASVIHVSEDHADQNSTYWGQYAASKKALEVLAHTQAKELIHNSTIRSNILVPGAIKTATHQRAYPGEAVENQADPNDIMTTILFLIGPDGRNINGEKLYAQPTKRDL